MRINEVKETREYVIRTEYVAEDGTVFYDKDECKKYEESALFAISKKLKRLGKRDLSHNDINDCCSDEEQVEIFDVQTEEDLENLKRYLYLVLRKHGLSECSIKECFSSENGDRKDHVFDSVTVGHEVLIFWNFDCDWFWVYKDGSINGYCEFFREKIEKLTNNENE